VLAVDGLPGLGKKVLEARIGALRVIRMAIKGDEP